MDDVFKALADPTRRALLDRLYARPGQTLGALTADLGITRQGATKHLALLEAAKLVAIRWSGREKLHYLNPVPIREIHNRWVSKFASERSDRLLDLKRRLEEEAT
ncbi:MAG: ArsR/SmtB family transcription factor [Phycisphaerae bacterium]